jgi:hypothetical protein
VSDYISDKGARSQQHQHLFPAQLLRGQSCAQEINRPYQFHAVASGTAKKWNLTVYHLIRGQRWRLTVTGCTQMINVLVARSMSSWKTITPTTFRIHLTQQANVYTFGF